MQILIILNCKKYAHKRQTQIDTWLKQIQIPYYHIIGDNDLENEYLLDQSNNVLYVKCKDTYEALPQKTYLAVNACLTLFPDLQYLLKTDDDMKCNIDNFNIVLTLIRGFDYGGEVIHCVEHMSDYHYPYVSADFRKLIHMKDIHYCPGRFYFLSKKACSIVQHEKEWIYSAMFEDYAIGHAMITHGIKALNLNAKLIFYDT
jgi:hypothetical protein